MDNPDDFQCTLLGSLGFSTRFIMAQTGFSHAQVAYRLRRARIRRADYRDGGSAISSSVLRQVSTASIPQVVAHLQSVVSNQREREAAGHVLAAACI
jgi:hypothetical protein